MTHDPPSPIPFSPVSLQAKDFRILQQLEWEPDGVSVLVGPNGSGKSTVLDIVRFVRDLFLFGHEAALRHVDGRDLQRHGANPDNPVEIRVCVADITWVLRLPVNAKGLRSTFGEELYHGDQVVLRSAMFQDFWFLGTEQQPLDKRRCCAQVFWDRSEGVEWMRPLVDLFESTTWYPSYWLNQVKRAAEDDGPAQRLHWTGRNLWKVLAEWQAAPIRYRNRFEWVMQHVALAFPGKLARIEFVQGSPYLFAPGAMELEDGLPPRRAADGVLTGLLHLTALAGTPKGGWVLFDEFENQLHPWAIRSLIAAARERALAHGIRVVLTTHSPVVLDAFADDPDQIFVMDGSTVQPQCLTDLHDDDVLAQSRLGTLYDRLFFGAPSTESPT